MSTRHVVHAICLLAMILLLPAANARAELAAWDQAQVTALGKELVQASNALYETFRKQPPPSVGSMQSASYQRLKQFVRMLHVESHEFVGSLEKGEGREQTLTIYDNLMQARAQRPRRGREGLRRARRRRPGRGGAPRAEPARSVLRPRFPGARAPSQHRAGCRPIEIAHHARLTDRRKRAMAESFFATLECEKVLCSKAVNRPRSPGSSRSSTIGAYPLTRGIDAPSA